MSVAIPYTMEDKLLFFSWDCCSNYDLEVTGRLCSYGIADFI